VAFALARIGVDRVNLLELGLVSMATIRLTMDAILPAVLSLVGAALEQPVKPYAEMERSWASKNATIRTR